MTCKGVQSASFVQAALAVVALDVIVVAIELGHPKRPRPQEFEPPLLAVDIGPKLRRHILVKSSARVRILLSPLRCLASVVVDRNAPDRLDAALVLRAILALVARPEERCEPISSPSSPARRVNGGRDERQ